MCILEIQMKVIMSQNCDLPPSPYFDSTNIQKFIYSCHNRESMCLSLMNLGEI